jgi:flagellar basal-body rod modification protein FlgD
MNPIALSNILTQQEARVSAYASATPAATSTSEDATTISSSDFMTLLVTEMKNQDPTQPTDPAQYVQQLVGVNSLEQLVDVNKQLTSMGGSTASTSTS